MVLLVNGEPIKQLGGGVRKRAVITGPLPAFADVGFYFDARRDDAIWADMAGSVPITDNTVIELAENLGFDPLDLDQGGATRWRSAGGPDGGAYIQGGGPSLSSTFPHTHPQLGPLGTSWFGISRHVPGFGAQGTLGLYMTGFPQLLTQLIPDSPLVRTDFNGTGFQTLKADAFTNEWFWAWAVIAANGDWSMQLSGETMISGNDTYTPVLANQRLFMAASSTDFAESAIWPNHVLSPAEITALITYLDTEYGGAFPIP